MDRDEVEVHKDAKRERGQYPSTFTELAWSIKDLLYTIKSTEKMTFVHIYFRALKRKPVARKSDNAFRLSRFLVSSRKKLSCTRLDFGEMLLREQNVQSRAGSIAPSCPLAELAI